ncbi:hypothetical protein NX059_006388 [Plenodomus lindquistii]|nr:hypothetical protein NX059_006388 [Plenodomus lindquistii]
MWRKLTVLHRGSVGGDSGLHPAEKFDPPVTAVLDPGVTKADPFYHQPISESLSTTNLDMIEPKPDSSEREDPGHISGTHASPRDNDRFEQQSHFPDNPDPDMYIEPDYAPRRKSGTVHDTKSLWGRADYQPKTSDPKHESSKRKGSKSTGRSGRSSRKSSEANEPRSAANPHKNDFLNMVDPRVDFGQVRRDQADEWERERARSRDES